MVAFLATNDCAFATDNILKFYNEGVRKYNAHDYASAAKYFLTYAGYKPRDAMTRYYLANSLIKINIGNEQLRRWAIQEYLICLKLQPTGQLANYCIKALNGLIHGERRLAMVERNRLYNPLPNEPDLLPRKARGNGTPFEPPDVFPLREAGPFIEQDPRTPAQLRAWKMFCNPVGDDEKAWAERLPQDVVESICPRPILHFPHGVELSNQAALNSLQRIVNGAPLDPNVAIHQPTVTYPSDWSQ